jgi:uncharacterized protein (TIGR02171 family)
MPDPLITFSDVQYHMTVKSISSVFLLPSLILLFCIPHSNDADRSGDALHPGMKKITGAGKTFQQGWNSPLATLDEKPGMNSSFTYDYWIDTTEVTQRLYYDVLNRRPVADSSAYGTGDNYPVYSVSWFDAALFCNARSKAENLDTIYSYSGIKALSNNVVYELVGLRYDLTRDGYRLPTEAEWEFAARGGTSALLFTSVDDSAYAITCAWFGKNSSGKAHPVGTLLPNSLGLYDMAGNLLEWTNDWKGPYDGKDITNSIGALEPNNDYEKVVKGGSYTYGLQNLRPSYRKATYATMLSSANEYVGFRCARGPVPDGSNIGIVQSTVIPNPVTIMTGNDKVRSFFGTSSSKIVFVNVTGAYRTLCFIDFRRTLPYLQEYLDDKGVYMPTISPDGRYVAYCSGNEGQSGPSTITIRSLDSLNSPRERLVSDTAYIPRWWVNPLTSDTFIIYTNSSVSNGNEALWKTTRTYMQKISGGKPDGSPDALVADGSFHDGLSHDKKFVVTGYNRLMVRNLATNAEYQMFISPSNGKDADGSNQVCNVSLSPDTGSAVRCMFLDFGYPRTSAITNDIYGIHEYLFISTMSDSIVGFMHCPNDEDEWDNTEWSNRSQFAVGCGRNSAGQSHAIYAINVDKKSSLQIVTGMELQQPYLWLGTIIKGASDSLGRYNDPPQSSEQAGLADKLLILWQICESLDIALIGSSQMYNGIDPRRFTGSLNCYNLASPANAILGQKILILNYILKHCPNIKMICTSFDLYWLMLPDGDYTWRNGVGQSKGYIYDSTHAFWPGTVSNDFKEIIRSIPITYSFDTACMGFFGNPSNNWGGDPPPIWETPLWDTTDENYKKNMSTIRMLTDTLRNRGVHFLVINFPISPYYKNTGYYSWAGPSRNTAHEIISVMERLDTTNAFLHFYDANMDGDHDYGNDEAANEAHLSELGAVKLTGRVDSLIHSILGK